MPHTRSAKKRLRQNRKRYLRNRAIKEWLKETLKKARVGEVSIDEAYSVIDKACKRGVIHRNKAARLKSKIAQKFAELKKE